MALLVLLKFIKFCQSHDQNYWARRSGDSIGKGKWGWGQRRIHFSNIPLDLLFVILRSLNFDSVLRFYVNGSFTLPKNALYPTLFGIK